MSAHTPGPWKADFSSVDRVYIRPESGGLMLASLQPDSFTYGNEGESIHANARLMAASPELLEALDEAVRLYTTCALVATPHEGAEDPLECGKWVNMARAAIAKAEGCS